MNSDAHRSGSDLARLLTLAADRLGSLAGKEALDVATGGGHVALALAQAGARVTASDLTPGMLAQASNFLREQTPGVEVVFREADAGRLPFDDSTFDLVTCRIAAHHFPDPQAFLGEAERTLRPGGLLVLIDNIAPQDPELARAMNGLERKRDEAHVEAYAVSWWVAGVTRAGLETVHLERFWREKSFREWARRTPPEGKDPALHADEVEEFLRGLSPRARNYLGERDDDQGRLASLRHEVMILLATSQA
ncbi:MAG TPA: class I SAM-dependent methyltransferase [Trueperaceae bacterium]